MPANDEILYLFTTAANSKPTYRRGILDLLTYPSGHVQQFSYRRSDIHPSVDRLVSLKTEAKAVVVFVDMDPNKVATYVPLRRVNILELTPTLVADPTYNPEERVKLFLRIGSYIEYQSSGDFRQWHQLLAALDAAREVKAGRAKYFVVPGPDVFGIPQAPEQLSWEYLVNAVAHSTRFSDSIFLRLSHVHFYGRGQAEVTLGAYREGPRAYSLRPGQAYQLDFDVFVKPGAAPSQGQSPIVMLTSSSEVITATKPFQSVVSGLVQESAILSCKRTIEETRAALTMEIGEPVKDVVNTPSPVLLLDVSVSRRVLWVFLILVFLGGLLVSSDKDALGVILPNPALWLWLAKFVGSVLLTIAAFMAFRKLPSGQA